MAEDTDKKLDADGLFGEELLSFKTKLVQYCCELTIILSDDIPCTKQE